MTTSNDPMHACPKFDGCSAPICPLDADWPRRIHRKGEPVCFYLLEYVKPGSRARFQGRRAVFLYKAMESAIGRLCSRHAPLRRAVERAKRTGSRLNTHSVSGECESVSEDRLDAGPLGAPDSAGATLKTGDPDS